MSSTLAFLRKGLAVVFIIGVIGTGVELVLLEHTEDLEQWIPLVLFATGALSFLALLAKPSVLTLRIFVFLMLAYAAAGTLGTYYHYEGNVEFELERTPEIGGLALFKAAMMGATPALAPGTMIQLGLIGLLYTFRHPARRAVGDAHSSHLEEQN